MAILPIEFGQNTINAQPGVRATPDTAVGNAARGIGAALGRSAKAVAEAEEAEQQLKLATLIGEDEVAKNKWYGTQDQLMRQEGADPKPIYNDFVNGLEPLDKPEDMNDKTYRKYLIHTKGFYSGLDKNMVKSAQFKHTQNKRLDLEKANNLAVAKALTLGTDDAFIEGRLKITGNTANFFQAVDPEQKLPYESFAEVAGKREREFALEFLLERSSRSMKQAEDAIEQIESGSFHGIKFSEENTDEYLAALNEAKANYDKHIKAWVKAKDNQMRAGEALVSDGIKPEIPVAMIEEDVEQLPESMKELGNSYIAQAESINERGQFAYNIKHVLFPELERKESELQKMLSEVEGMSPEEKLAHRDRVNNVLKEVRRQKNKRLDPAYQHQVVLDADPEAAELHSKLERANFKLANGERMPGSEEHRALMQKRNEISNRYAQRMLAVGPYILKDASAVKLEKLADQKLFRSQVQSAIDANDPDKFKASIDEKVAMYGEDAAAMVLHNTFKDGAPELGYAASLISENPVVGARVVQAMNGWSANKDNLSEEIKWMDDLVDDTLTTLANSFPRGREDSDYNTIRQLSLKLAASLMSADKIGYSDAIENASAMLTEHFENYGGETYNVMFEKSTVDEIKYPRDDVGYQPIYSAIHAIGDRQHILSGSMTALANQPFEFDDGTKFWFNPFNPGQRMNDAEAEALEDAEFRPYRSDDGKGVVIYVGDKRNVLSLPNGEPLVLDVDTLYDIGYNGVFQGTRINKGLMSIRASANMYRNSEKNIQEKFTTAISEAYKRSMNQGTR